MTASPSDLPQPLPKSTEDEGGLDIRTLLAGIVKHWPIVAALTILATGVALLWSKSRPRIYQASSMLEFDPNPVRPLGNQQDPTTGWMFYLDSQEMYQTPFTIVTSDTVIGKAVRDMGLQANTRFNGGAVPGSKPAMEAAINGLRGRVTVEPVKNSRLFYVRVEDTDPVLAAELAHGYFAVATGHDGGAEQVRELPVDAELVVLRRPIAGG